jgi:hypothetical protein
MISPFAPAGHWYSCLPSTNVSYPGRADIELVGRFKLSRHLCREVSAVTLDPKLISKTTGLPKSFVADYPLLMAASWRVYLAQLLDKGNGPSLPC